VIIRRIFPAHDHAITLEDAASRAELSELYRPPQANWLRLNFIASVSGNVVGADGTSEALSNPVDRRLLGIIRQLSDVVLIGAGSLRTEGYLRPRRARLAVVTSTGDLAMEAVTQTDDGEAIIVLCPASAEDRVRASLGAARESTSAEVVVLPDRRGKLTPSDMVAALRERGLESIVCEGGPILARQFIEAGLVDELCLSTSPVVNGASLPIFGAAEFHEVALTLTQLLVDEKSGLYARWAVS
jgi:riboflavin biosynthesis pyrimidine reductase